MVWNVMKLTSFNFGCVTASLFPFHVCDILWRKPWPMVLDLHSHGIINYFSKVPVCQCLTLSHPWSNCGIPTRVDVPYIVTWLKSNCPTACHPVASLVPSTLCIISSLQSLQSALHWRSLCYNPCYLTWNLNSKILRNPNVHIDIYQYTTFDNQYGFSMQHAYWICMHSSCGLHKDTAVWVWPAQRYCSVSVACTKILQCECGLHKDTAVWVWLAQRYCSVSVACTKILQCECGLHKDTAVWVWLANLQGHQGPVSI